MSHRDKYSVPAALAETTLLEPFREFYNEAFRLAPDKYSDQYSLAKSVILESLYEGVRQTDERIWERRRQVGLLACRGEDFGAFYDYFQDEGGASKPSEQNPYDLDPGDPNAVRTNSMIMSTRDIISDPLDFLDESLETIVARKAKNANYIGPENYATALKFFSDKYKDLGSENLDFNKTSELVNEAISGFLEACQKEDPNFIEMTNVYVAIRRFPKGTINEAHTNELIQRSFEKLPEFDKETINIMFGAIAKLDLSKSGEAAATLIDLAQRKRGGLSRSIEMLTTLSAIANLPEETKGANRVFETFIESRHDLELSMDLTALDYASEQLSRIAKQIIDDPALIERARSLSLDFTKKALFLYEDYRRNRADYMTREQLNAKKETVRRIANNYKDM